MLWWCLMLAPVGGVLIFLLPLLFLVSVGAAFVVVVDSVTDRHLTREQRLIGLLMSVAVIPAGILGVYIAGSLGSLGDPPTATDRFVTLAATLAFVLVLWAVKRRVWQIRKKTEWNP